MASPDVVYQALEDYGQHFLARSSFGDYDKELELALAERNDRLIDLALAKNAATNDLVTRLYQSSLAGTGDPDYDKAVRLACLANRMTGDMLLLSSEMRGIDHSELKRLAMNGDDDELVALLRNPTRRHLLATVYGREGVLENIPDERWFLLVRSSVGNPGLNTDESSVDGPDFMAWDIQKAFVELLKAAPVERQWVRALYSLLLTVNPENARALDSEASVLALLERWRDAKVPKMFDEAVEEEGYYSSNTLVEEFCGLMAALYGRVFVNNEFRYIGPPDSGDLLLRCAHYGQGAMTPEQMQQAYSKDGNLFALAALFNDQLMLNAECRQQLEECLGIELQHVYASRCEQLQSKYKWFNPRPVTEALKENLETSTPPANAAMVDRLSTQVSNLKGDVAALSKRLLWGLLILGALVLAHR